MDDKHGYSPDVESLLALVQALEKRVQEQAEHIARLEAIIEELRRRLGQNSKNSSRPPSSDGFVRPKSQRKKTGRSPGGQKGHPGRTLKMTETPDEVVVHQVDVCLSCGTSLSGTEPSGYEKRQVFDIPPVKLMVTEHRGEKKDCPSCKKMNVAAFPEETGPGAVYGLRLKAMAVYLTRYQLLPYERTAELFGDLFGVSLSPATVLGANTLIHGNLEPVEDAIKEMAAQEEVAGFDETGVRIDGKLSWLHVVSTPELTHFHANRRRGKAGIDSAGVLPKFSGTAVHDHWKPYFTFPCAHSLCNAHHLRELTALDEAGHKWPAEMIALVLEIKAAVEETKQSARALSPERISVFELRYDRIVTQALKNCIPIAPRAAKPKRGRKKQTKEKNLLDRLATFRSEVLAFMYNFSVPFDNNAAERDLRMAKVQQKISGSFRSDAGAENFCRIRGYISTARKNAVSVIDAIEAALRNKPFLLVARASSG